MTVPIGSLAALLTAAGADALLEIYDDDTRTPYVIKQATMRRNADKKIVVSLAIKEREDEDA